jgi:hypothetical protein
MVPMEGVEALLLAQMQGRSGGGGSTPVSLTETAAVVFTEMMDSPK